MRKFITFIFPDSVQTFKCCIETRENILEENVKRKGKEGKLICTVWWTVACDYFVENMWTNEAVTVLQFRELLSLMLQELTITKNIVVWDVCLIVSVMYSIICDKWSYNEKENYSTMRISLKIILEVYFNMRFYSILKTE